MLTLLDLKPGVPYLFEFAAEDCMTRQAARSYTEIIATRSYTEIIIISHADHLNERWLAHQLGRVLIAAGKIPDKTIFRMHYKIHGRWREPTEIHEIREVVMNLAFQIEREMRLNDHKGGWHDCTPAWLLERAQEEIQEARGAFGSADDFDSECGDAGAFLAMAMDRHRKIWEPEQTHEG